MFADPTVGCKNNPNSCRLVRDVTKQAPSFAINPLCFTLPDQPDIVNIFIAAMQGTVNWNKTSFNKTKSKPTNPQETKLGQKSYHNKIWRFACPCAGAPRNVLNSVITPPSSGKHTVNTVVHKDRQIDIVSRNIRAIQTVTTTIQGNTKHTIVATKVTGQPLTPITTKN